MKLRKFMFEITQSLSTFILLNTIWKILGINTNLTREIAIVDGIDIQILVYQLKGVRGRWWYIGSRATDFKIAHHATL